MNKIKQLEQELAQAKVDVKIAAQDKEIVEMNEKYIGKCFASKKLQGRYRGQWIRLIRFNKLYREEDKIILNYDTMNFSRGLLTLGYMNYSKHEHKQEVKNGIWNLIYDKINYLDEIHSDLFKSIWEGGNEISAMMHKLVTGKLIIQRELTGWCQSNERNTEKWLIALNIEYIDIAVYANLLDLLRYSGAATIIANRYIMRQYFVATLEQQIKYNTERANSYMQPVRIQRALLEENIKLRNWIKQFENKEI